MTSDRNQSEQFTENLQQCHRRLFNYIYALVRDLDDAQDVFQETCAMLWQKFGQFRPGTNFTAWAFGVAQFKASEYLRSKRRYRIRFSSNFAEMLAAIELREEVKDDNAWQSYLSECIEKLPTHQQQLLRDCYSGTRNVAEIAAALGRPPRSLHNSLRSIRERLLLCIQGARRRELTP
jgi:RNA polymerase sigma-70 factor, ECF subfamily